MKDKENAQENIVWWAGCDDIAQMGPYDSQMAAWKALVASKYEHRRTGRLHVNGAYVWPEES